MCNYTILFALEEYYVEKDNLDVIILCRNCHSVITMWIMQKPLFLEYYKSSKQEEKIKLTSLLSSYEQTVTKMLRKNVVGHPAPDTHIRIETTVEDLVLQSLGHIAIKKVSKILEKNGIGKEMKFGDICIAMAEQEFSPDQVNKALKTLQKWNKVEHPKFGFWRLCQKEVDNGKS